MVHTPRQPALIQIVPLTSYFSGTPSTSFVQPSLDHHAAAFGSQGYATGPRRNSHPSVGMERAASSRGQPGYQPAVCERRASYPNTSSYPYLPATHATKETHVQVRSTRFEVTSPQRKAHYVPATPPQRVPTPPGLNIPRRPSPPNSPPSERVSDSTRKSAHETPKQSYMPSPPPSPKRGPPPRPSPVSLSLLLLQRTI
ncbi:hypothetical protein RSAG8_07573, partial [Rhizoctonia solani AG-8 WAC10335]